MDAARRRFLHTLAAAPLVPALAAEAPQTPPPAAASPVPSPAPSAAQATARALAGIVEQRYGAQLAPGDVEIIAKGIADALEGAARLRARPLTSQDEPVSVFRARAGASGAPARDAR